jgi:ribonuclease HII
LGPLVLCGVCFTKENLNYLTQIGVKDSKKLNSQKRKELANLIENNCHSYHLIIVSPREIDQREQLKITMNRLEELKMAEIVNKLRPDILYLDAADVNEERFGLSIAQLLDYKPKKIISKHKADDLFPIVSAASIIAKNKRDTIIEQLKQKYGEIGSGYPSDEKTKQFLLEWIKKHKRAPKFARKTWDTTKKIIDSEIRNKKITEYFT